MGEQQPNIDDTDQEQTSAKVELIRLLYLLPFFMQQFLNKNQSDVMFTNKRNMIQFLKKSLPSIGINKKSDIFERLESIQRIIQIDENTQEEELMKQDFEQAIKLTIDLVY